ncbi:hypothetical protein [Acidianus manzaensis]|uniref:Uncharacterized protein n=1 Tax=Acidianus manzaensis TaxID=282676 RepID=A0A1W6JY23_9CREN|nr:hypothetical protein [Acidianus manzaensis]ARM75110.1 hypothetical protein B6F84_03065 [Acidianus manzaensis]
MKIAIPKIIYEKNAEYTLAFAVLPTTDKGEVIDILKKNMRISECNDIILCYPSIFGGIFIFKNNIIVSRIEYQGYICNNKDQNALQFNINDFLQIDGKDISCFRFEKNSYCFSHKKINESCIPIDNIGLRFIV